jgi:hypothetical protein
MADRATTALTFTGRNLQPNIAAASPNKISAMQVRVK